MSSSPKLTRDICTVAIEAAEAAETAKKIENIKAQNEYVRKLMGDELFPQCTYDAAKNMWIICGHEFCCFTESTWLAPHSLPCLAYYQYTSHTTIQTLADLGVALKWMKAEDELRERRSSNVKAPEEPGFLDWFKSLFR